MSNLSDPANQHETLVPSNSVNIEAHKRKALKILTSGNIAVVDINDTIVVYPVTAGETFPFRGKRINSTGTTATAAVWWD